jgi:hypothetical protein
LANAVVVAKIATGELVEKSEDTRNPNAVALGKLGGRKGGKSRARALSASERKAIAKKAANKRWGNSPD